MTRVLEISPRHPYGATVTDDRHENGNSVASLVPTADAFIMGCALRAGYAWPFCKLQFHLGQAGKGVDFSQFDSVTFDMRYAGEAGRKIRLHMTNFEPEFSTVGDWNSQRYNSVEFDAPAQATFTIPVNVVRTADWWITAHDVPLEKTYTRLDNVTALEISTGSVPPGQSITIDVRSIEFRGKWISKTRLLTWLVGAWIGCGLLGLSLSLLHVRSSLSATNARLELLAAVNKALQLEARDLANQAHTDPLTGALNRQGLREVLMKRLHVAGHVDEEMAVVFMDLDHFKRINDQHGHDAGDEVLRRFAAVIRGEIRSSDKLVRWGGEEFLLLSPETDVPHAVSMLDKLRAALAKQEWPQGLRVTSSFGVTSLKPEEDIGAAIKRADGALYLAKANGRNRVEIA
ncbi:GGDEF domain-containing protein [Telluria mixta]|uniref:diguanylate cyclase n=1 Tax=Telluria mixta TaxID=34071 RepID=A0ABT2C911_9BURK|nr:GGDEF domain-containing protein [Telluria mixta]MCS0633846.1 GGDEF domain-containing protein [Telluria mixta]WEM93208.1 GGDEF domain-containing protein [Telluria mixta]